MIAMAALHLTFIVTNNIITYMCGGVVRNKLYDCTTVITKWLKKTNKKPSAIKEQAMLQNIPEKTYNYCEYQEQLLGVD